MQALFKRIKKYINILYTLQIFILFVQFAEFKIEFYNKLQTVYSYFFNRILSYRSLHLLILY